MSHLFRIAICLLLLFLGGDLTTPVQAQTDDDDIWRSVKLGEMDFQKKRSYAVRLYGFYRFTDDGIALYDKREHQYYCMYEGIFQLDIRYSRDEDDGALVIVGRDLVHPEKDGKFMDFYELKPYTFLEKAHRDKQNFTLDTQGDTTRVSCRYGLAGIAVRDTARQELRIDYNALAPDTAMNVNLLVLRGHLSNVHANAVYRIDDFDTDYVPQGNLKEVKFDGNIDMTIGSARFIYRELTELYVDSVVYMTRDEYRAANRLSKKEQRAQSGYTAADIDRLRDKYGVAPLTETQRRRIELQQDWDDMYEQWRKTRNKEK